MSWLKNIFSPEIRYYDVSVKLKGEDKERIHRQVRDGRINDMHTEIVDREGRSTIYLKSSLEVIRVLTKNK